MISGLVIHLSHDEALSEGATSEIQKRGGVEMGDQVGQRLPLVVESTETTTASETAEWLKNLTGVVHVDVTFVHLEE